MSRQDETMPRSVDHSRETHNAVAKLGIRARSVAPAPGEPTRSRSDAATEVAGKTNVVQGVTITNPDRPIPDEEGVTKLDVVRYYEAVAPSLLLEIAQRPLSLIRCPGGDFGRCFFRRHPEDDRQLDDGLTDVPYVRVQTPEELIGSVQGGTFEFHSWGTSLPRVDRPDRITLDLDPDAALDWETFREACELTRALLDRLELRWFVKTTGGKGIHFVLPIARRHLWDDVKAFAHRIAEHLAQALPTLFTSNASKAKRKGRVFVDYLRNAEGASAIAAYSLRARPGLPVAMPIPWAALDQDVRGDHFNLGNVPQMLAVQRSDPWAEYPSVRQSLAMARRMLK